MSGGMVSGWYGVRCLFDLGRLDLEDDQAEHAYEERVTVWRAEDIDAAIVLAEEEAREYAEVAAGEFVGLVQAYQMSDDLVAGAEVFSLVRLSDLDTDQYLDRFFATGRERQRD